MDFSRTSSDFPVFFQAYLIFKVFSRKHYLYSVSNFRQLVLCQEPNLYLLVGLENGDVAHNMNPDICFLTKAKWLKIKTRVKIVF